MLCKCHIRPSQNLLVTPHHVSKVEIPQCLLDMVMIFSSLYILLFISFVNLKAKKYALFILLMLRRTLTFVLYVQKQSLLSNH